MNNNLTFDDVAQALKIGKSLYDLKEDINFYNENILALQRGGFEKNISKVHAKISYDKAVLINEMHLIMREGKI